MRLLVLGGSGFVGRSAVDEALARGWEVTTLDRGSLAHPDGRVRAVGGDRLTDGGPDAVRGRAWDLVIDTWSGAPKVVLRSARALQPEDRRPPVRQDIDPPGLDPEKERAVLGSAR